MTLPQRQHGSLLLKPDIVRLKGIMLTGRKLLVKDVETLNCMLQHRGVQHATHGPHVARHDEAHFWLNGYVNKQNCRIWSEANPQVYVETPLHPEKLTVWCALWAGGFLLQKR
ncbi:hypothetical protein TNCV_4768371 [Trichonephila clavipes]|nr:hypothetical protein TNCV_4768371 [Trichonephila clavipes]